MESHEKLQQELREAERAEALGWTGYRFPVWEPLAMTVWAGTFTAGLLYLDGGPSTVSSLLHLAVAIAYIAWDRRSQAAYPSSKAPVPREYVRPILVILAVPLLMIPVTGLLHVYVATWLAVLFSACSWGATVALYNRTYARSSARVRERLA